MCRLCGLFFGYPKCAIIDSKTALEPKSVRILCNMIPEMLGGGKGKYIIMLNTVVVSCPDPPISAALRYI